MTSRITCYRWAGSRLLETTVSCLAIIAVIVSLFVVSESIPLRGATSNNSVLRRNRQQSDRITTTTTTTTTTEDELHDYVSCLVVRKKLIRPICASRVCVRVVCVCVCVLCNNLYPVNTEQNNCLHSERYKIIFKQEPRIWVCMSESTVWG